MATMNEAKKERMECDCCSHRTKMRTPEELADIEGQIKGIRGMLEKNAYCPDILMPVSAANAALNSFTKVLLSSHIRSCVTQHVRQGDDSVIDELVETLQRLMK